MPIEDMKKRFVNEIKLRAYDDKYVDRNEEREILQIAIQLGINIDSARAALAQVCESNGYILESSVIKSIREQVDAAASDDGKVDKNEYDMIVATVLKATQGKRTEREVRKMIVTVMEDTGNNKVKVGWFSDWYAIEKRDLGMI